MHLVERLGWERERQNLGVVVREDRPVVSSRDVARVFEKDHKEVLRKIRSLDCSPDFNERNFTPVEYKDSKGEIRPEYLVTRDGFTFLVMGYTGEKAARFKEAYINEFNRMELSIKTGGISGLSEMELVALIATNMADFQKRQQHINGAHSTRLMLLEGRLEEEDKARQRSFNYLLDLPESFSTVPPEKSVRSCTYHRVLAFARSKGLSEKECFGLLYSEFKARYHVDLKSRKKRRNLKSALQCAENDGLIDDLYSLACFLFPSEKARQNHDYGGMVDGATV